MRQNTQTGLYTYYIYFVKFMKIGQRIFTIYGWVTIKGKRYSPIGNRVVFYGVDEQGIQRDITSEIIIPVIIINTLFK